MSSLASPFDLVAYPHPRLYLILPFNPVLVGRLGGGGRDVPASAPHRPSSLWPLYAPPNPSKILTRSSGLSVDHTRRLPAPVRGRWALPGGGGADVSSPGWYSLCLVTAPGPPPIREQSGVYEGTARFPGGRSQCTSPGASTLSRATTAMKSTGLHRPIGVPRTGAPPFCIYVLLSPVSLSREQSADSAGLLVCFPPGGVGGPGAHDVAVPPQPRPCVWLVCWFVLVRRYGANQGSEQGLS